MCFLAISDLFREPLLVGKDVCYKMQRKQYSVNRPVPRQTLHNQKRKRRKLDDENASEKQDAVEAGDLSPTSDHDGEALSDISVDVSHSKADNKSSEDQVEPSTSHNINQPEGSSNREVGVTSELQLAPDSGETSELPLELSVPLIRPTPAVIPEDDDEDGNSSSDDELHAFFDSKDSSSESSEEEEHGDIPEHEESPDEMEGESEAPILRSNKADAGSATVESEESPPCPPEVKYPMLVHLLRTKHQLTKDATEDVMEIINDLSTHTLNKTVLPKDARTLSRIYDPYLCTAQKHFFCCKCGVYVGTQKKKKDSYICGYCNSTQLFKDSKYFYYLPLKDQLSQLFENEYKQMAVVFEENSNDKSYLIKSAKDGAKYKELFLKFKDEPEPRISISFSCDGVPVFKSNNSSLWPVLCAIDQLPMKIRKRYILMPAVWYGTEQSKPVMNQYLYPFLLETRRLHFQGFKFHRLGKEVVCKVTFTKNITDSVARPLSFNSVQFNAEFGCYTCLNKGQQVPKGRGSVRVYPHINAVRRTIEESIKHTQEAVALCSKPFHVKGVRGETILSHIPNFNIIDGIVPEYLHCAILGVTRQFCKLWVSSKNHEKPYYVGLAKDEINKKLLSFKPPSYVSRPTRDLDVSKFWKGHEWYWWAFAYSFVVLKGILPPKYLKHWMLFF